MKHFSIFSLGFILPHLCLTQTKHQIWTTTDQQTFINELKNYQSGIIEEVDRLSDKQIQFKPESSQWSIVEVLEPISVMSSHYQKL